METVWYSPWFSFDTETTHVRPRWAKLVGMSFCCSDRESWYLPIQAHHSEPCLGADLVLPYIRNLLERPDNQIIGQNLKYDLIVARNHGIHVQGVSFDTLIASYLLDAGSRRHGLDLLAAKYLQYKTTKITSLIGQGNTGVNMRDVPLSCIAPYAAEDAWVVAKLAPILYQKAEEQGVLPLLRHVEIPLIEVLAEMEYNGIFVDQLKLDRLREEYAAKIQHSLAEIKLRTNDDFNPDSPIQIREELFENLGLSSVKLTETGAASTDAASLKELGKEHELPKMLSEYRQLVKLNGTYVAALPEHVFPETSRVHCSFNQDVTATGRLSSSDPNMQNIPAKTEAGQEIRSLFIPPPGKLLVAADYSQIEIRVLAHYSQDTRLIEAYQNDEDIHAIVASQVGGVPLEEVTDGMRKAAKAINFGIIYGQGPNKLAATLGITREQAKQFIEQYFVTYPTIRNLIKKLIVKCGRCGYAETLLGRRRYIDGIDAPDYETRGSAERMAVNTVIQGSAADIIKLAMLEVSKAIAAGRLDAKLLLQVHDELVFEVPEDKLAESCQTIEEIMVSVVDLTVPMKVDVEYGPSWSEKRLYGKPEEDNQPLRSVSGAPGI